MIVRQVVANARFPRDLASLKKALRAPTESMVHRTVRVRQSEDRLKVWTCSMGGSGWPLVSAISRGRLHAELDGEYRGRVRPGFVTAALNCLWAAFFVYMIVLFAPMAWSDGGVWIALVIAFAVLGPWMTIDAWRSTRRLVGETEAAVARALRN